MPFPPAVPLLRSCVNALTLNPSAFAWLFAPKLTSLGFSLRTTFASLLALAIAFWMELGQPQWAAMTVWIVAQGTRGESISKGRWRVVGTLAGVASAMTLVSMAPQQPWLFFPLLAAWVGLCTALGTLVNNFRSYAFVLTAYTCAIVAISAVDAQDQIFDIAVSRGTYILLGVICEMVVAAIFIPDVAAGAQKAIRSQLREIISRSSGAVRAILLRQLPRESDLREIFSLALTLNDRMEFSAIEAGRNEPLVRSARAVLEQVTRLTSRGVGMRSRLAATGDVPNGISQKILTDVAAFFERLPEELDHAVAPQSLRHDVWTLQKRCQAGIESTLAPTEAEKKTALNDRIVLQGLALLLGELEHLLGCYAGDMRETTLSARFRLMRPPDWGATFANGIRSALAVLLGAMIWEVTAWSYGALFVTFVAVVCARFASFSNTVIASRNFLFGAVWAVALSIIPVFLVMPVTADYPILCLAVGLPMIVGGLAARNPAIAALAASFANFFPYMISPENHFRTDEIHWFNTSLALLAGLGFGVLVFRHILPFSLPAFISNFRAHVIRSLHRIAEDSKRIGEPAWVGFIVRNMEQLIANGRGLVPPEMDGLLKGAFSAMTMGRNLMQLRHSSTDVRMPSQAQLVLTHMFEALSPSSRSVSAMTALVERTLDTLFQIEKTAMGVGREQVTMALGCLMIVRMELRYRNLLLDPDYIADLKAWS